VVVNKPRCFLEQPILPAGFDRVKIAFAQGQESKIALHSIGHPDLPLLWVPTV
jgi:hypothetical protein